MMLNKNTKTNLGALLLRLGLIDEDQLEHAMNEHQRTGIMLSKILVRLGMVSEDALTQILGTQMQSTMKMRLGEMLLHTGFVQPRSADVVYVEVEMSVFYHVIVKHDGV